MIGTTPNSRVHIDENKSITVYDLKKNDKIWTGDNFDTIDCIIKLIDYECEIFQTERYTRLTNNHKIKFRSNDWKDISNVTESQKYKGDIWFIVLKNSDILSVGNDNEKIFTYCNDYSSFFDLNKLKENPSWEDGEVIIKRNVK